VGPLGKPVSKYAEFAEEAQLLASIILDVLIEQSQRKPLLNPKVLVKIRTETLADERAKALLLKAHRLVSDKGSVCFSCLLRKGDEQTVFSSLGRKFMPDLNGDWETDTLRTGCLGSVAVNLPRIAYECEKDEAKFLELLRESLEMAARALEIKYGAMKQNGDRLLPFLLQNVNGDQYFRLENSSRLINLVGMKEALESFCGKNCPDEKASQFVENLAQCVSDWTHKARRRRVKRLLPSMLPDAEASERLAQLDIDRFGFGKVKYSGTREKPFYSTIDTLPFQAGQAFPDPPMIELKKSRLHSGGSLTVIGLGETEYKQDELMSMTRQLAEVPSMGLFVYDHRFTYCMKCQRSWLGLLPKCPSCGATSTLTRFSGD